MASGEVLYFDDERGTGFISGDDGNRYVFARADLTGRTSIEKGTRVEFRAVGDRARGIVAPGQDGDARVASADTAGPWEKATRQYPVSEAAPPIPPASPPPGLHRGARPPPPANPLAKASLRNTEAAPNLGLFGYFKRCVTSGYARFSGRARRKEYWGFALFAALWVIAAAFAGGFVGALLGFDEEAVTGVVSTFVGFAWLAILLPSFAVGVRRVHDLGLSGWFVLLMLIPSIGSLIMIVFALIPSQKEPNRWGPVPEGVLPK